jgi:hypothetical protein
MVSLESHNKKHLSGAVIQVGVFAHRHIGRRNLKSQRMRSPEFIEKDTDTTYMAFLRLLREYYTLQADVVDAALEREKLKND